MGEHHIKLLPFLEDIYFLKNKLLNFIYYALRFIANVFNIYYQISRSSSCHWQFTQTKIDLLRWLTQKLFYFV